VGLLLTGGTVFARRSGFLDAIPGQGAPELKNELAGAESPYLRSAAGQPVHWQRWGPDAFRLATKLNRPVWLDVGAIWCHWCHVMDRESYEDPDIASLLNAHFVPVKVDRDRRPDIDSRYQVAFQALNRRGGGWPLTMMLLPDGVPFAGFTYLPPTSRQGRPGIEQLAPRVAQVYREQRDRVEEMSRQVAQAVDRGRRAAASGGALTADLPRSIADDVGSAVDSEYGGFGSGDGPKFPNAPAVRLALAEGFLHGDEALQDRALETLDAYARSGMYDQVRGGFFRYSVNRALTRPHFEKMDYVQAGLLRAYLDAYRLTGDDRYARVARGILAYVNRTLSDRAEGGFYAHQDADVSMDDDGSYYTWTPAELRSAVTPEAYRALRLYYGIDSRGEMPDDGSRNVPRVMMSPARVADSLGITPSSAERLISRGTRQMKGARDGRRAPLVETTEFTDRNAYLITAYLEASQTLGDSAARSLALRSLDRLLERAVDVDGTVVHVAAEEGGRAAPGLMRDYAYLAEALTDAYQVTGERRYLAAADRVMNRAVTRFWDSADGGFWDRPEEPEAVGLLADRGKVYGDSPLPGDNAVAAEALDELYLLTTNDRWRELAEGTLSAFAGEARGRGTFVASFALAAELFVDHTAQTVVIGASDDPRTGRLATAAWTTYRPGRLVTVYDPSAVSLDSLPEAVAGAIRAVGGEKGPRAYVCVGRTCAPPTDSPDRVRTLVRRYGLPPGDGETGAGAQ